LPDIHPVLTDDHQRKLTDGQPVPNRDRKQSDKTAQGVVDDGTLDFNTAERIRSVQYHHRDTGLGRRLHA